MRSIHFFLAFALAMLVSFGFVACGGDDDPTSPTPTPTPTPTSKIDIPATENTKPVFGTEGGTATVKFTASQAWTATTTNDRASEWLSITPTSGIAGNSTLNISTKQNDTYDERSATITIKSGTASQTIVVTQKQKDALLVTSDKYEVDAEGGEISVEVKTNIDYSVKTDADWISQSNTRALNTSNLTFAITENEETSKREGHITISSGEFSETVTIYQSGNTPTIIISKNEYSISSEGGDISVEVRSNVDVSVTLPKEGWITESTTRSMSTHTYVFAISKNEEYDARSAEILFTNKANNLSEKITITQMQQDAIIVAKDKYEIDAKGGTLTFEVQTNVDFETSVDADWIAKADTRALHSEKLSFNIKANDTYEDRSATIAITGNGVTQKVFVLQHGLVAVTSIELDKTSLEISVGSSTKLIATVNPENAANKEVKWSSSDESIATVDKDGNIEGLSEGEVVISVATVDGNKTADCKIVVKPKEISVSSITLDKTSVSLYVGETIKLNATISPDDATNKTLTWTSSDETIASIDEDGNIKAQGEGSTTIIVSSVSGEVSASCEVIVKEIKNIKFADSEVKRICVENWDTNGDGELSYGEAEKVEIITSLHLNGPFIGNKDITSFDELKFFSNLKTLGYGAFKDCYNLSHISLPKGLKTIEPYAFENCALTSIDLPEGLLSIEGWAFSMSNGKTGNLQSINIPNSVTYIGGGAFSGSIITSISLPNGIESLNGVFYGCSNLREIVIPQSVKDLNGAFKGCKGLTNITIPEGVISMEGAFRECENLQSIIIPEGIESLKNTFERCYSLSEINIPKSVTNIESAFVLCQKLRSVAFSQGSKLTSIGDKAFWGCHILKDIKLPESILSIGEQAFSYCSNLNTIEIPKSIQRIGIQAFQDCGNLFSIYFYSATPPVLLTNALKNRATIFVPSSSLSKYVEEWPEYADRIQAIPE